MKNRSADVNAHNQNGESLPSRAPDRMVTREVLAISVQAGADVHTRNQNGTNVCIMRRIVLVYNATLIEMLLN